MTIDLTDKKASANPTKTFFVKMITKDINLEDCILDLIDNSVDGAWRSEGSRPMGLSEDADLSKYSISITLSPTSFRIMDNCGGMTLDDAVNHAFSFGRPATEANEEYSIGVYGIGMKRAVFKLGTDIKIRSTFTDEDKQRIAFAVPINVATWAANDTPPWDFDIEPDEPLEQDGVEIVVDGLNPGASRSFESPSFLQNLRRTIGRDYTLHMNRGLKILINGRLVSGMQIELRASEDFTPLHVEYKDEIDGMGVSVEIIGGMLAPPPDTSEPDEKADSENPYGWYVGCNGRIVVAADKSSVAGWGADGWPIWHPQYAGFLGLVLFTAANPAALPLTTTKRNIDTTSEVYRRASPRMRDVTRKWIDYTNARKQALEEAKAKERQAALISIYQLKKVDAVKLPALTARTGPAPANVHYSVPVTRMTELAKALGSINLAYREVGLRSFDYTYKNLVGDEVMPSFDAINYSLRPSKSIQRQIVFDGVRLLPDVLDLDRLAYIGFGSIWFTDFVLAHKLLRVDDMVSIEGDDIGYRRAKFNAPYSTVRVEPGLSTEILPKLFDDPSLAGRPWMLWLDYDYEFNESVRDDVRSVIENAPVNSILIITFNGLEKKYGQPPAERVKRLRELLGSVVPDELDPVSCKAEQMQVTLADLGLDFMKSIAADIARPGGFVPAFRVLYRDGAPMVTIGGILPVRGAARGVRDLVNGTSWPSSPSKPISAPPLTMREAAVLQSLLPCRTKLTRTDVQNLGFDLEDEQIEAFETYYRQYPAFAQIVS